MGWSRTPTPRRRIEESSARHRMGQPNLTNRCAKGRCKPSDHRRMPGAGLSDGRVGKAQSEMPAFQPCWENPPYRKIGGTVETSASFRDVLFEGMDRFLIDVYKNATSKEAALADNRFQKFVHKMPASLVLSDKTTS